MNDIVDASQSSTRELQEQIDIYKEKNRRELTELQRTLKEKGQELEKYLLLTKTLQEEVQSWATPARPRPSRPHVCPVQAVTPGTSLVSRGLPCRTADDEPLFRVSQFKPPPPNTTRSFRKMSPLRYLCSPLPPTNHNMILKQSS